MANAASNQMNSEVEESGLASPSALAQMATRGKIAAQKEQRAFEAALRLAFGRMAAECPGLEGQAEHVQTRVVSLSEVLELAEPNMFLSVLEGQGERMGLLLACPQVLGAMVEAQATGTVLPGEAMVRKPTRTDAALMAPLIDSFLRRCEALCAQVPQFGWIAGYVYGSYLDNPRPLGLVLDEGSYHIMHLRVALGLGAKQGDWILVLPEGEAARADPAAPAPEVDPVQLWERQMQATVGASAVQLDAVLCRVQLTLSEALRLRAGDILRIPETTLESLLVESLSRDRLMIGRLGQARGQRAVRLTADPGVLKDVTGATPLLAPLKASVRFLGSGPKDKDGADAAMAEGAAPASEDGGSDNDEPPFTPAEE